jgi:hypothetical protein
VEQVPPNQEEINDANNKVVNDEVLYRFMQVQSLVKQYEEQGIYDGLNKAEEEFEIIKTNRRKLENNYKILRETTLQELHDFEIISLPNVQSYFKHKEARDKAITKEQEEYLQSLNMQEQAASEFLAINDKFEAASSKLTKYKEENKEAIDLLLEQMEILSKLLLFC